LLPNAALELNKMRTKNCGLELDKRTSLVTMRSTMSMEWDDNRLMYAVLQKEGERKKLTV
jgi:hypothetical protein